MSRKAKNTNELYFEDMTSVTFVMLPTGYFYKGKYYTIGGCYKALEKDGEVETHRYDNGTWKYNGIIYHSLEELYEWNQDKFAIPLGIFRRIYDTFGVYHNPTPCTYYTYDKDDSRELFESKEQVIDELEFYMGTFKFLAASEDYEEWYLEDLDKDECIAYLKKSIKERLEILNNWRH